MKFRACLFGIAFVGASIVATSASANGSRLERYSPVFSWTGFYVGLNAGWQTTDIEGDYIISPALNHHNVNHDSGIFGGHVGYQHQFGNWVLGVEAAWSGTHGDGSSTGPSPNCLASIPLGLTCTAQMNSLFTIGPRVGYAADRWLAFVGGGYAQASIETDIKVTATGTVLDSTDQSHNGWYIGGGIEYLITRNLSFGLEYQHVSLGTERHASSVAVNQQAIAAPAIIDSSRDMSADIDIIRARLTYRFGEDRHSPMK